MLKLKKPLQDYLEKACNLDSIYACEMQFHRELTQEELDYMNEQMKEKGMSVICHHCQTCFDNHPENQYHIDRVRR